MYTHLFEEKNVIERKKTNGLIFSIIDSDNLKF